MKSLVNEFSWSKSRDGTFLECPRQYWFQYYGAWGGWEVGADPRTREIYILKQLKTRQMWVGERVHTAVERTLRNLSASDKPLAIDAEEIIRITIEEMRLDFKSSRSGIYRSHPKSCGLIEHEYRMPVTRQQWREAAATAERCLRNFYGSELFREIRASSRAGWLELEEFSSFNLDGVKVHVVLDFARRQGDEILIYDWKTGGADERDNRVQMACYAFYAHQRWGASPEQVRPVEVNLNRGETTHYQLTSSDLERTKAYLAGSIADMRRMLRDAERNLAVEEDFRKINELRVCCRCKFSRVCDPEVLRMPPGPPAPAELFR